MSKKNDLQINSNNTKDVDKQANSDKERTLEDKNKKKVNFDSSFEQTVYDLSSSQYNNNSNTNHKGMETNKEERSDQNRMKLDEENKMKTNKDLNTTNNDKKRNFDPNFQSQEFLNIQNKYADLDAIENSQEKLGSNSLTTTDINNNHYPTNRGAYFSKMDIAEKNYISLMKKFEKLLLFDEKIDNLDEKRAYDQELELLKKQNIKLIKNLEKMNDILDNVVDFSKLALRNPNFLKGKKFEKNEKKKENIHKNSLSKSSQLTAVIGDNRLVDVYKQDYLKLLKRYETISQDNYINKVEENLFHLNNEIESISRDNKNLNYKQKSSECKFEMKNSQKLNNGVNSDLSITSFDYNNQKKMLDEINDKIDKNKFDIKNNEDKIIEWNLKYNKYKEIAGFYNISEESLNKTNSKTQQKVTKIEKFSLMNKMNILYSASNSIKNKYEQMILKNEKSIFHLKNVRIQTINYYKIKSAILDELSKQVKQMYDIRKTYEDERFLRSLQEDDDYQLNYHLLNNNLKRSADNFPLRNHNQKHYEHSYREKSNLERRELLPKEEIELIYSLDNAKRFVNEYQHQKNLKSIHSKEEPIEYENEEEFFNRMNELKLNLSLIEKEKNEEENVIDEKLEKEIIEKYSKKTETDKKIDVYSSHTLTKNTELKSIKENVEKDIKNSKEKEVEKISKMEQDNSNENSGNYAKEKLKNKDENAYVKENKSSIDKSNNKENFENYVKIEKDKKELKENNKDSKQLEKEEKKSDDPNDQKNKKNILTGNLYRENIEQNKKENIDNLNNKTKNEKKKTNLNDLEDLIV